VDVIVSVAVESGVGVDVGEMVRVCVIVRVAGMAVSVAVACATVDIDVPVGITAVGSELVNTGEQAVAIKQLVITTNPLVIEFNLCLWIPSSGFIRNFLQAYFFTCL
jgi:hypothetical protein